VLITRIRPQILCAAAASNAIAQIATAPATRAIALASLAVAKAAQTAIVAVQMPSAKRAVIATIVIAMVAQGLAIAKLVDANRRDLRLQSSWDEQIDALICSPC
jgi:hypothetical protein